MLRRAHLRALALYLSVLTTLTAGQLPLVGQISGPNAGSVFVNVPLAGSSTSWIDLGNASASDDVYVGIPADGISSNGADTDLFQVTGFGISVPNNAVIDGITVSVERRDVNNAKDYQVSIVKNGVVGTEDKSLNPAWSAEEYIEYGGATDLWSETWTPSDINGSFGVAIAVKKQGGGANPVPEIDHVLVWVNYSTPLPVEVLSFSAQQVGNVVELNWETLTELNNDFFQLEESQDGLDWTPLATITGAGTSTVPTQYHFADDNPWRGRSYYRLLQTDYDGSRELVGIESITLRCEGAKATVSPSPASTFIRISNSCLEADQIPITEIINSSGQSLPVQQAADGTIDVSELSEGLYWLRLPGEVAGFSVIRR